MICNLLMRTISQNISRGLEGEPITDIPPVPFKEENVCAYTAIHRKVVNIADVSFVSASTGATAMGNPFPVDLTLDNLTVTGYSAPVYDENRDRWSGGTKGQFNLQFLTNQGKTEVTYRWYDDGTKLGWYDSKGTTKIDGSKVDIPAGKGHWCQGNGLTLNIPAPEL